MGWTTLPPFAGPLMTVCVNSLSCLTDTPSVTTAELLKSLHKSSKSLMDAAVASVPDFVNPL